MHFWYIVGILDTFPAQKYGKHISRHISITTSASFHINISFEKIVLTDVVDSPPMEAYPKRKLYLFSLL